MAMKGIEEFVKEYVRQKPDREPVIHANAAQLDVISWFLKNGYEPTDESFPNPHGAVKMHNLDEILDSLEQGDGKYTATQGDYKYVFPGDFKGPHKGPGGTKADEINIDASALIHLRKVLDVGGGEPAEPLKAVQRGVKEQIR